MNIVTLLVLTFSAIFANTLEDCPTNAMTYFSSYTLGRQTDLNKTF